MRGLDKASSNAQDGVSSVQNAEGALTEVHSMLQRMNELAVQAANGTNSKETDRKAIQDEIYQLNTEIDVYKRQDVDSDLVSHVSICTYMKAKA